MKTLRIAFWAVTAVCLIVIGIANRGYVTLRALPEGLAGLFGISPDLELPLFVVIFLGIAAGLMIGFLWEWVREHQYRAEARAAGREVVHLKREIDRMRDANGDGKDDVLQLLESSGQRR